MRRRPEMRRRPDMTESPSTGSGGQSSVLCPDCLPVYREILCPHNTVIQSSRLSIHILQHSVPPVRQWRTGNRLNILSP